MKEMINKVYRSRRDRLSHPYGKTDNGGRWYPSEWETCECCSGIRSPSRRWPWSYMSHCRTKTHVAQLFEKHGPNDPRLINEASYAPDIPEKKAPARACADGIAYKMVAVGDDGRLYSVYDGSEWIIGRERKEAARKGHSSGFYVYETLFEAKMAQFPSDSVFDGLPRAIVKCEVGGNYCRYKSSLGRGKLAFSRVKPLNVEVLL